MPQFDLLIIHTQSSLFLNLVLFIYLLYVCFYILPINQAGKYRSKVIKKEKRNNINTRHVYSKHLNKIHYQYESHLKIGGSIT